MRAARLEEWIAIGLLLVGGEPFNPGSLAVDKRPASVKLKSLRSLLEKRRPQDKEKIEALCKAANDALEKRHMLMHGVLFAHKERPAFDDGTDWDDGTGWLEDYAPHVYDRRKDETMPLSAALAIADALSSATADLERQITVTARTR